MEVSSHEVHRFEELPVWQDAIELAVRIFELTAHQNSKVTSRSKIKSNELASQFPITSLRVLKEGTTQETLTFLYISQRFLRRSPIDDLSSGTTTVLQVSGRTQILDIRAATKISRSYVVGVIPCKTQTSKGNDI